MCIFAAMNENIITHPLRPAARLHRCRLPAGACTHIRRHRDLLLSFRTHGARRNPAERCPVTLSRTTTRTCTSSPQLIAPDADKLEHIMSLFIEKGYQERTSIWVVLFRCWPGATMAAACCPIPKRSEGAALRSHRPTSRHPFLREAASGAGSRQRSVLPCYRCSTNSPSHTSSCTRVWASSNTKER